MTAVIEPEVDATGIAGIGGGHRFTVDGSGELENRLAGICDAVLHGILSVIPSSRLEGVLLGGGYGRGEGGVLRTAGGDAPYNDMEFYVFARGTHLLRGGRHSQSLDTLAHRLSQQAGVELEFKLLSFGKLRRSKPSMFYYDLVMGHRWIAGREALLDGYEHHRRASNVPVLEATRLLMNRCSGLLYAREKLEAADWTPRSADFVARNIAKAQLAFGDAVLTVHRQYDWSCRERNRRLHARDFTGSDAETIRFHHDAGMEFKLHPVQSRASREELRARHDQVVTFAEGVWLWVESRRLGAVFESARSYALGAGNKLPDSCPGKNLLLNMKAGVLGKSNPFRNPRQRIFEALALLLWEPRLLQEPGLLKKARTLLNTRAATLPELTEAYRRFWRLFN